ncbi:hypothetical protein [Komagataeibacter melaceti]|uniref:hypothetical protein n=1 Tax=Komagataeibacter melaceti TaxID=2766577 RepID=UPI0011E5A840|nr:hypothetical protein [Komagataeibacter melaceti]
MAGASAYGFVSASNCHFWEGFRSCPARHHALPLRVFHGARGVEIRPAHRQVFNIPQGINLNRTVRLCYPDGLVNNLDSPMLLRSAHEIDGTFQEIKKLSFFCNNIVLSVDAYFSALALPDFLSINTAESNIIITK